MLLPKLGGFWLLPPWDSSQQSMRVTLWITTAIHLGTHNTRPKFRSELQEAYNVIKERGVKIRHAVFHGVTKSVYFYAPDGNMFELYCNVPPEKYRKSTTNPYGAGTDIDDELRGAVPQRPGTVAP
jgi:catechol-2,3-dioxygenase